MFKVGNMNKKETKSPIKSKLENKSLRQKLGHPAGLPKMEIQEIFVQAKVRKKEPKRPKYYPIKFSSKEEEQ